MLAKHRAVRWFWTAYPLLVTFVIVVTANHFVFDAVLGALTAGCAYARRPPAGSLAPAPVWGFRAAPAARHRLIDATTRVRPASAARRCATR